MKRNGSLEISTNGGCHRNGSSAASPPAIDNDAYRKYVQSLLALERDQQDQEAQQRVEASTVRKLVAQAGGFIGQLMKTKSANGHLNKLNETTILTSVATINKIEEFNGNGVCEPNRSFLHGGDERVIENDVDEETTKNASDEQVIERPTTRAFERQRRQAVREQTVRTKTLKQWNLHDVTQGKSDFLEPRQRLESLRSLTNTPCGNGGDDYSRDVPIAKEYYCSKEDYKYRKRQQQQQQQQQQYQPSISAKPIIAPGYPKFDYTNFLPYSTVDYSDVSTFPSAYLKHKSMNNQQSITAEAIIPPPVDDRIANNNNNNNAWCDVHKIKEAVSHESIANISQTRQRWQQMVDENQHSRNCRSTTPNMMYSNSKSLSGYSNRSTPIIMNGNHNGYHQPDGLGTGRLGCSTQSLNANLDSPTTQIDFRRQHTGNTPASSPAAAGTSSFSSNNTTLVEQRGAPLDLYEKERLMFIAYVQSHQEVIASLGITVPFHVRQKFPSVSQMKVELRDVTAQYNGNGYSYHSNESNGYAGHNGSSYSPESHNTIPKYGRYIKNPQPPAAVSTAQRKIVRKQSSVETMNGSNNSRNNLAEPASSKKPNAGWKLAEWTEPPPAVNNNNNNNNNSNNPTSIISPIPSNNNDSNNSSSRPNNYRSAGESLIAREIRELREREEELRRSRSELGLANLEDIVDSWKQGQHQQPSGMRSARSLDHLHILVENGLQQNGRNGTDAFDGVSNKPFPRSGSMDHLHFASSNNNNEDDDAAAKRNSGLMGSQNLHISNNRSNGYHASNNEGNVQKSSSPKSAYERFLSSHSSLANGQGDYKLANQNNELQYSSRKRDFSTIEARIEKELEDIRQREEELRRQREAAGLVSNFLAAETSEDSSKNLIREYDNQKNLNFKPVYGAPYELHKMDDPDEMLLAPGDGSNGQLNDGWMNVGDNRLKF